MTTNVSESAESTRKQRKRKNDISVDNSTTKKPFNDNVGTEDHISTFSVSFEQKVDATILNADGPVIVSVMRYTRNITDWSVLGLLLRLTEVDLHHINTDPINDTANAKHKTIVTKWLQRGSASWAALVNGLRDPLVNRIDIADLIAKDHPYQDINDPGEVLIACRPVSPKWKYFGARLGILENTLTIIEADYSVEGAERCLKAVIDKWLSRSVGEVADDVVLPTWRNLCAALSAIDKVLAEGIALEHGCNYISPAVSEIASHGDNTCAFLTQSCGCGQCTIKEWRSGSRMCPNTCYDDRPMVLLADRYHPAVAELTLFRRDYDRQIRLCTETDRIAKYFHILSLDTWRHLRMLDEAKISEILFELGIWLSNIPMIIPAASGIEGLVSLCHNLRVSWFNFSPLHYLAEQYLFPIDSNVEYNWRNYCAVFTEYSSNRHLADYTDVFFQVENRNIFLLEIDVRYDKFTLADVEDFSKSLSTAIGIPTVSLHLVTVKMKCLLIYFYYCYSDYLTRFMSLSSQQLKRIAQIKPHKILSLTDLYDQFEYNKIQKYYYYEDLSSSDHLEQPTNKKESSTELQLWKKQAHAKDMELSKKEAEIGVLKMELEMYKDQFEPKRKVTEPEPEDKDAISKSEDQFVLKKKVIKAEIKDTKEDIMQELREFDKTATDKPRYIVPQGAIDTVPKELKEVHGLMKITRVLIHGAPCVGKTCVKRLVLNKPAVNLNSTRLVEDPVRAISTTKIISVDQISLQEIDEGKMLEMIRNEVQKAVKKKEERVPSPGIKRKSNKPTTDMATTDKPTHQTTTNNSLSRHTTAKSKQPKLKLISKIAADLDSINPNNPSLLDCHHVHLVDSGGQPQFSNLLPLILQSQTHHHMVVIRLDKLLHDMAENCVQIDGKKCILPESLSLTNYQLIERVCQQASGSDSRVFIIGTYWIVKTKQNHYQRKSSC